MKNNLIALFAVAFLIPATSCANQKPTPKLYFGKPLRHYAIHAGTKFVAGTPLVIYMGYKIITETLKDPKTSAPSLKNINKHSTLTQQANYFTTFLIVATALLQYHTPQLTDKYILKSKTPRTTKQNIISSVSIAAGNALTGGIGGNLFSEACVQYFDPTPNPENPTSAILRPDFAQASQLNLHSVCQQVGNGQASSL